MPATWICEEAPVATMVILPPGPGAAVLSRALSCAVLWMRTATAGLVGVPARVLRTLIFPPLEEVRRGGGGGVPVGSAEETSIRPAMSTVPAELTVTVPPAPALAGPPVGMMPVVAVTTLPLGRLKLSPVVTVMLPPLPPATLAGPKLPPLAVICVMSMPRLRAAPMFSVTEPPLPGFTPPAMALKFPPLPLTAGMKSAGALTAWGAKSVRMVTMPWAVSAKGTGVRPGSVPTPVPVVSRAEIEVVLNRRTVPPDMMVLAARTGVPVPSESREMSPPAVTELAVMERVVIIPPAWKLPPVRPPVAPVAVVMSPAARTRFAGPANVLMTPPEVMEPPESRVLTPPMSPPAVTLTPAGVVRELAMLMPLTFTGPADVTFRRLKTVPPAEEARSPGPLKPPVPTA